MHQLNLRVTKGDLELAEAISAEHGPRADAVFTAVLTASLLLRHTEESIPHRQQLVGREKPMAATEFFARLRPRRGTDQVLGAAYFLETWRDASSFSATDLRRCLLEGRLKPPSNVSLAILRNAKKGLMAQVKDKSGRQKSWMVTQTGVQTVEEKLTDSQNA
jgi:hypothetical protein